MNAFEVRPGKRLELVNGSARAQRFKVRMPDGTSIVVALHPGAEFSLTAGRGGGSVTVEVEAIATGPIRPVE